MLTSNNSLLKHVPTQPILTHQHISCSIFGQQCSRVADSKQQTADSVQQSSSSQQPYRLQIVQTTPDL
ncbi:hypothetical protein M8C21_025824 [Ambrosia artemisiifolia]|uniref:Uncharacterized protein n=1 Tax=Ambrosia artemisiifolia TaxID=4212 RepID=A0AAD5GLQ6_AMBAR|nr:hypothetical protein M8C21_025824 [Ambrosia artemisiifolia]